MEQTPELIELYELVKAKQTLQKYEIDSTGVDTAISKKVEIIIIKKDGGGEIIIGGGK